MTHALKCWPEFFKAISDGSKPFELRKDDRPFEVGDDLIIQEYRPEENSGYTGEEIKKVISYILRDAPKFGLKQGYIIIGLKEKENN